MIFKSVLTFIVSKLAAILGKIFQNKVKLNTKIEAIQKLSIDAAEVVKDGELTPDEVKKLLADILAIIKA